MHCARTMPQDHSRMRPPR
jgi:hypothetical protein